MLKIINGHKKQKKEERKVYRYPYPMKWKEVEQWKKWKKSQA